MIVYQANKSQFLDHALRDDIEDIVSRQFRSVTGYGASPSEVRAWKYSLLEMAKVLQDEEIPADARVAIEYQLPQSSKRIDFVIAGEDDTACTRVVIVELKQWSESRHSEKDAVIWARRGGPVGETEGLHPSYQAWSYAAYLEDFNEAVQNGQMGLQPCAYLHNHPRNGEINHPHYREYIERAPLFLEHERAKLQEFIRRHVRHGDRRGALYMIEHGEIRPSKMLADAVVGSLQGKPEFVLIDDQKIVYETILQVEKKARTRKQVVLVQGGPGTGKSVVAVNLLATLIGRKRNARYVSKNAAPRTVYAAKLAGTFKKTRINNLFSGSGAFVDDVPDTYDALIVDEAHRLNEKGGLYGNLGDNQVRELIRAARCTVFFVDDDQRVTVYDIGDTEELRVRAREFDAEVTELKLSSQFRCNGADGYLAWLDDTLDIHKTANTTLDTAEFDFRVIDSPTELHDLIKAKNRLNDRSRVVAGYCWKWPSKRDPQAWDIELPAFGYQRRWNLDNDGSLWIVTEGSVEQVGCIHTCQGLELDYVGVIVGPDLVYRDGHIVTDATKRASSDRSVRGLKRMLKQNPGKAHALADRIIKNTYRTLMTRGIKGCYVYCTDRALARYLRSRLRKTSESAGAIAKGYSPALVPTPRESKVVSLRPISDAERAAGVPCVPVMDLRFAAGAFSNPQALEENVTNWVELPDWVRPQPDLFVAQVVGESMNRRIPNGAWCLFRANPSGTRDGKVVVVQHQSIDDPETGGKYTIKIYSSEKVPAMEGGWRHRRITLRPDSDRPEFEPIVIDVVDRDDEFSVVAEMLAVLQEGWSPRQSG